MAATETTAPAASSLIHEPTLFDSEDEGGCIILAGLPAPSQNSSYRRDGSSCCPDAARCRLFAS